jgi:hypothetical protein
MQNSNWLANKKGAANAAPTKPSFRQLQTVGGEGDRNMLFLVCFSWVASQQVAQWQAWHPCLGLGP